MGALGWLLNLDFAGGQAVVVERTILAGKIRVEPAWRSCPEIEAARESLPCVEPSFDAPGVVVIPG